MPEDPHWGGRAADGLKIVEEIGRHTHFFLGLPAHERSSERGSALSSTRRSSSDANTLPHFQRRMHTRLRDQLPDPIQMNPNPISHRAGKAPGCSRRASNKRKRRKPTIPVDPVNGDRNDRCRDRAKRTVPKRIGILQHNARLLPMPGFIQASVPWNVPPAPCENTGSCQT
jgi:hypothetical protein